MSAAAETSKAASLRGAISVILAATAWGCWSVILRPTGLPGAVTAPIMLAGLAIFTIPMALREPPPRWSGHAVRVLLLYSVCDAVNAGTFFSAMQVGAVAVAVLTHSLGPVLVAVAAPLAGEKRSPAAVPAAVVALFGILLVLEPWRDGALEGQPLLCAGLGVASAIGYAGGVLTSRELAAHVGPARALGGHAVLSALLLVPFGGAAFLDVELADVPFLLVAILVPGAIAGTLFVRALGEIGSARAAVLALLEPLVACVVGYLAFGEHLGPIAIVGALMVLGAAAFVALRSSPG